MARKNSKKAMDIEEISYEYEVEENDFGLDEEIVGIPVASFSFNSNSTENTSNDVSQFRNYDTNYNSKSTLSNTAVDTSTNTNIDANIGANNNAYDYSNKTTNIKANTLNLSNENLSQKPMTNNYAPSLSSNTTKTQKKLIDHRFGKPSPNGITPPVDGETFDIKRTYPLRKSTVRKLNELKAAHPDINAYLSTILDSAIVHYYNYIFHQGGSQK